MRPRRTSRKRQHHCRASATLSFGVLVVEDDPIVGASTVAMLEDLGHSVIEVGSAARALEMLRSQPEIDIVITDYAMPGMTGIERAAKIHRIRPGLPVVIATGYSDVAKETLALPCLDKPYRQEELAALIETLLQPQQAAKVVSAAVVR
jgi:CheY-like chemotaxis protein